MTFITIFFIIILSKWAANAKLWGKREHGIFKELKGTCERHRMVKYSVGETGRGQTMGTVGHRAANGSSVFSISSLN